MPVAAGPAGSGGVNPSRTAGGTAGGAVAVAGPLLAAAGPAAVTASPVVVITSPARPRTAAPALIRRLALTAPRLTMAPA